MKHVTPRALETKSADDNTPPAEAPETKAVTEALAALTADVKAGLEAAQTEAAAAKAEAAKAKARADELERKFNRPGGGGGDEKPIEAKAWGSYLRKGRDVMDAEEAKSLRIADDTTGGYLRAPETFVGEILKRIVEFSPVRAAARVTPISTSGAKFPKRTGEPTAHWVDEDEQREATGSTYGMLQITAHEMACHVDVSAHLLEDAAVDIEAEVAADLAEEFGRLEASAFVNGTGVKQPAGIMADTAIANVASGSGSAITGDGLIDLFYALPAAYRASSAWGMNSRTMAAVRKLKDGQGQYLWQEGLAAGQPATLLGRPVIDMPEMPDVAGGAFPIVLGDFAAGYRILDRVNFAILRDPYTRANVGQVRMHARRRVGGGVTRADAFRKLRIAAS